jgi:hypothetical protein
MHTAAARQYPDKAHSSHTNHRDLRISSSGEKGTSPINRFMKQRPIRLENLKCISSAIQLRAEFFPAMTSHMMFGSCTF